MATGLMMRPCCVLTSSEIHTVPWGMRMMTGAVLGGFALYSVMHRPTIPPDPYVFLPLVASVSCQHFSSALGLPMIFIPGGNASGVPWGRSVDLPRPGIGVNLVSGAG